MTSRLGNVRTQAGYAELAQVAVALTEAGLAVEAGLAAAARALGFDPMPPKPKSTTTAATSTSPVSLESPPADTPFQEFLLWQPHTFSWTSDEAERGPAEERLMDVEAEAASDAAIEAGMKELSRPAAPLLSPRRRLAPMLQRALTSELEGRALDVARLVRCYARGELLRRLPRLPRRVWPPLLVLVDASSRLAPFWPDQDALVELLVDLVGAWGLSIRVVEEDDFDDVDRDGALAGLPVLALTDLGWYGGEALQRAWLRLGRRLRRGGERLHALVPVPPRRWTAALGAVWSPLAWERPAACEPGEGAQAPVDRLLDLAAHALRLEPGLLRALRMLLPRGEVDAGAEADAWLHDDLQGRCPGATVMRSDRAEARRARLAPELRGPVRDTLRAWHWHRERRPELWYLEALALAEIGGGPGDEAARAELARAERFAARLGERGRALSQGTGPRRSPESQMVARWLDFAGSHAAAIFRRDTAAGRDLQIAWYATHDRDQPPPDADPSLRALVEQGPPRSPKAAAVRQVGEALEILWPEGLVKGRRVPPGGLVGTIWAGDLSVDPVERGVVRAPVVITSPARITAAPGRALELRTDRSTLGLRVLSRPAWATAIGRDPCGLWADMEAHGVQLRLRWIPPGRFLMGSPTSEPGRDDDEVQHEVVLTRGLWLGDAPVTQALWTAVIGDNPSRFKDPDRPVEQVSWDDAQRFLAAMNELVVSGGDGELFRLPSEAEWEYACRAGTTTATHAGGIEIKGQRSAPVLDAIAWYSGNSGVDYDLDEAPDSSGWPEKQHEHSRAGTRKVKQKQPNAWGLFDMLGNVWEWCMDAWQPDRTEGHPAGSVQENPVIHGSTGDPRVDRGGGWLSSARGVRAAFRDRVAPGDRHDDLGFRLARGQAVEGPEGQPPAGR